MMQVARHKVPFENLNSPYEKTISETKDKNSMTLEKIIDKSDPATVGLVIKVPKKKQKSS